MMREASFPNVYAYTNARNYLADIVDHERQVGKYSTRKFAKKAGLGSSNYVRMIINGSRKISLRMANKIAAGFELKSDEARYFETMVLFSQAKNDAERELHWSRMIKFKKMLSIHQLSVDQYKIYSNWRIAVLHEALRTEWKHLKRTQIANKMKIPLNELDDYLRVLQNVGLVSGEEGDWKTHQPVLETENEATNLAVRGFHRTMLKKALETVDHLSKDDRKLRGLTLALSKEDFLSLVEKVNDFMSDINVEFGEKRKADAVYQVNFQLFPLMILSNSDQSGGDRE